MNNFWQMILGAVTALGLVGILGLGEPSKSEMFLSSVQIDKFCSGTAIPDPDRTDGIQYTVLSAKHCLHGQGVGTVLTVNVPKTVNNVFDGDRQIKMIVTDVSEESDLFLLQALKMGDGNDLPNVSIYSGPLEFGQEVWSVSFPLAETRTISQGYLGWIVNVPYFAQYSKSGYFQKSTTAIAPGSSGSGLFVETTTGYELIGVLTGMDSRVSFSSFYTDNSEVNSFLKSVKVSHAPEET
jgi:hypothetical protein